MSVLKTDYKDDIINSEFAEDRKYVEVMNADGSHSYSDVTPYTQEGDEYGAKQINHENTHTNYAIEAADCLYNGADLTVRFAEEIAGYANAWKWIKARIEAANFDGLHIGDYIPMYMGDVLMKMQIAGIDTYYKALDVRQGHHIDWISESLYPDTVKWGTTNNNGISIDEAPFMSSNVKTFLDGLEGLLPTEVKEIISIKQFLLEGRYSASGVLTDSTSWRWRKLGKLWLPSEYEIFGSCVWGTPKWSLGVTVQYPLFANSMKNRIKGVDGDNERYHWWLLTAASGMSDAACVVAVTGHGTYAPITSEYRVPICFRISE